MSHLRRKKSSIRPEGYALNVTKCEPACIVLAQHHVTMVTVTVGSTALVLILWGVQFANTLSANVAYTETITGIFKSEGEANLGMSYW